MSHYTRVLRLLTSISFAQLDLLVRQYRGNNLEGEGEGEGEGTDGARFDMVLRGSCLHDAVFGASDGRARLLRGVRSREDGH